MLASLRATARARRDWLARRSGLLPTLRDDLEKLGPALAKIDTLLGSADTLMRNANAMVTPDLQLQQQLANTLRDLSRTSAAVRSLVTPWRITPIRSCSARSREPANDDGVS